MNQSLAYKNMTIYFAKTLQSAETHAR